MAMSVDWNLMLAAVFTSLAVSATPGPNNIIVAAIGAHHGYRRALPYCLGVTVGFPLMLGIVGLGLGGLLITYPYLRQMTQIIGATFLIYLAYRIVTAPVVNVPTARREGSIYGFWYAVIFQWINPKAVPFAFGFISLYARPQALMLDVAMLMMLSALVTLPITTGWALTGDLLSRVLKTPLQYRVFNLAMGLLLLSAPVSLFFYQR